MSWWLAKGLVTLRSQINAQYPGRDKASDGSIGDVAHSSRTSDHNPDTASSPPGVVRAIDVDEDLAASNGERFTAALAEHLRRSAQVGAEPRLTYLIYEARICSAKSEWGWRPYYGENAHTKHLHISVNARADHDAAPWSVPWGAQSTEDIMATLDADDLANISRAVWGHGINITGYEDRQSTGAVLARTYDRAMSAADGIALVNKNVWTAIGEVRKVGAAVAAHDGEAIDYAQIAAQIKAQIGSELADSVVNEIRERLSA